MKYLKESKNDTYNVDNHFVNIVFHDSDTNIDGNVYCKAYNMKTNINYGELEKMFNKFLESLNKLK